MQSCTAMIHDVLGRAQVESIYGKQDPRCRRETAWFMLDLARVPFWCSYVFVDAVQIRTRLIATAMYYILSGMIF